MSKMKEGTKMLLVALAVLVCSLGALYFISLSESPDAVAAAAAVAVVVATAAVAVVVATAVVVVAAAVVVAAVVVAAAVAVVEFHLFFGFLCLAVAAVVIIVATRREKNLGQKVILLAILFLPMVFFSPLSRHNNANLVERDKAIAAGMRVEKKEGEVVLILPFELNGSNRYLNKVLRLRYCGKEAAWGETAERYQKGQLVWREAILRTSDKATTETAPSSVGLWFRHVWKDCNTTLTLAQ